jgi:hypothetical protein
VISPSPTTQPAAMTAEEWNAEGQRRFGDRAAKWKFQCPICKRVFSLFEFAQFAGPKAAQSRGFQECIGRVNGKGFRAFGDVSLDNTHGCDFAAYGLFTSGFLVNAGDRNLWVLPFADPPQSSVPSPQHSEGEGGAAPP